MVTAPPLPEAPPGLDADALRAVETEYAPLIERVFGWAATHGPGLVVGMCGAQGSGKSTVCAVLGDALARRGLRVASLSLDDLYLTRAARLERARGVHPLFATRGPPGTHDVALGVRTLDGLRATGVTDVPRFDKARDDRRPEATWSRFSGPADIVLFEGWCVGARPQPPEALDRPANELERREDADGRWRRAVNDALIHDYPPLFARLDRLVLLQAPGFGVVARWRAEQEAALLTRTDGGGGAAMNLSDIPRFVAHYERLTTWIFQEMPGRADLTVPLDEARRPDWAGAWGLA